MDSDRFELQFDVNHPQVKNRKFEESLALALMRALNQHPCYPDPVPLDPHYSEKRYIGDSNNFWLFQGAVSGHYTVVGRYASGNGDEYYGRHHTLLLEAEQNIRAEFRDLLLPDHAGRAHVGEHTAPTTAVTTPRLS